VDTSYNINSSDKTIYRCFALSTGVTANNAWLHLRVTAVNLRRLTNLGLHHTDTTWALT
jgi:hypothetical protein